MSNQQQLAARLADALAKAGGVSQSESVGEAGALPLSNRGVFGRVKDAVRYVVGNVTPATWFSPVQPLLPISQESGGRQWDFPVGYNLRITPRQDHPIGFSDLRMMGDSYDLLRLLIETRKDQMAKIKWSIVPVDETDDADGDPRVDEIESFLRMPDRRHTWQQWLRMLLEDMLVIDAATVLPRMDRGGRPYSLELVAGETVKPVIDAFGRTPMPPDVAYQQIIKGVPAADFSTDQLLYAPRNLRTNRVYGFSPVEQVMMTVNIALRRQIFQLQYYTEGSVPDLIMDTPANWTPQQIAEFDQNWNTMLRGDTANRRGVKWVPNGTKAINTKEAALKDEYDEWLARVCCFAFSVNPQPFVKQMNRATAETAQTAALEEGLIPLMQWVEDLMNVIVWRYFGWLDLRFAWQDQKELDPKAQAEIDDLNIRNGSRSIDEIRVERGDAPIGMGPAVFTQTGPVLLSAVMAGEQTQVDMAVNPPENQPQNEPVTASGQSGKGSSSAGASGGGTDPSGEPAARPKGKKKASPDAKSKDATEKSLQSVALAKRAPGALSTETPVAKKLVRSLQADVQATFGAAAQAYADQICDLAVGAEKLAKAADWSAMPVDDQVEQILSRVEFKGWGEMAGYSQAAIEKAAADGGLAALAHVGVGQPDVDMLSQVDGRAVAWSQERSAELVGMSRNALGELVPNPNQAWSIDQSTRDMLRSTVSTAIQEGWSRDQLSKAVRDDYAFSKARAKMVARTEINMAEVQGNLAGYKASGVVMGKSWLLGDLHGAADPCDANASDGVIGLDEPFSSGDMAPPQHPNCTCAMVPVIAKE